MKPLMRYALIVWAATVAGLVAVAETAGEKKEGGWMTDYRQALETAKAENKHVLLDFSGSDWCGWCIKIDKEITGTSAFREYAKKHLVLVLVDFPRRKPQSAELKKQNQELAEKFQIEGYPTLIVLNPQGEKVGQLGYMEGGPAAFLKELDKICGTAK